MQNLELKAPNKGIVGKDFQSVSSQTVSFLSSYVSANFYNLNKHSYLLFLFSLLFNSLFYIIKTKFISCKQLFGNVTVTGLFSGSVSSSLRIYQIKVYFILNGKSSGVKKEQMHLSNLHKIDFDVSNV